MAESPDDTLDRLCRHARESALLESIEELLGWDERTQLPPAAGEFRAEQMSLLSGWIHRRRTDPRIGDWLAELSDSPLAADPHSDAGATIRELRRDYQKRTRMPVSLVEELTRAAVLGQQAWARARQQNEFAAFQPFLEQIFGLKRQQAAALGYEGEPYDALLDEFEPGASTAAIAQLLADLRGELAPLAAAIAGSTRTAPVHLLRGSYPIERQRSLGKLAAAKIGFDFQRGRLDVSDHPFCAGLGPDDCRITTRYDEHFFPSAFFSILHEAGHGIYEQGLRREQFGLPPGSFLSLGIHESQSRLWENQVGRSRAFWEHFFPHAQRTFPETLAAVPLDDFCFAINDVRPSLIRVEADEATYNLHIIIRFELERAVLSGDLATGDLPGAWNEQYRRYLGIEPATDAQGVLQDIHWSAGLVGYFPTYSLGNLYAAQFYRQADADLGGLDRLLAQGDFTPLRDWLRERIHRPGRCYRASELITRVTGQALSHEPLLGHLRGKLLPLYGVA